MSHERELRVAEAYLQEAAQAVTAVDEAYDNRNVHVVVGGERDARDRLGQIRRLVEQVFAESDDERSILQAEGVLTLAKIHEARLLYAEAFGFGVRDDEDRARMRSGLDAAVAAAYESLQLNREIATLLCIGTYEKQRGNQGRALAAYLEAEARGEDPEATLAASRNILELRSAGVVGQSLYAGPADAAFFFELTARYPRYARTPGVALGCLTQAFKAHLPRLVADVLSHFECLPGLPPELLLEMYRRSFVSLSTCEGWSATVARGLRLAGRYPGLQPAVAALLHDELFGVLAQPAMCQQWTSAITALLELSGHDDAVQNRLATWVERGSGIEGQPPPFYALAAAELLAARLGPDLAGPVRVGAVEAALRGLDTPGFEAARPQYLEALLRLAPEDHALHGRIADWFERASQNQGPAWVSIGVVLAGRLLRTHARRAAERTAEVLLALIDKAPVVEWQAHLRQILELRVGEGFEARVADWLERTAQRGDLAHNPLLIGDELIPQLGEPARGRVRAVTITRVKLLLSSEVKTERMPLLERLVALDPNDAAAGRELTALKGRRRKRRLVVGGVLAVTVIVAVVAAAVAINRWAAEAARERARAADQLEAGRAAERRDREATARRERELADAAAARALAARPKGVSLVAEPARLDLGELFPGATKELGFRLRNDGLTDAKSVTCKAAGFKFSPATVRVAAGSFVGFTATYVDRSDAPEADRQVEVKVTCDKLRFPAAGTLKSPEIVADVQELELGEVKAGEEKTITFSLRNASETEAKRVACKAPGLTFDPKRPDLAGGATQQIVAKYAAPTAAGSADAPIKIAIVCGKARLSATGTLKPAEATAGMGQ